LALDAGTADIVLPTIGAARALDGLSLQGGTLTIGNVTTSGDQSYSGDERRVRGTQAAGTGDIDVPADVALLADTAMTGNAIDIDGSIDGAGDLQLAAAGAVTVRGDIGATQVLNSLVIDSTSSSVRAVTTSGAQRYDSNVTVNGNLTGGSLAFGGSVAFPAGAILRSDTIDFDGGDSSVSGGGRLTIAPLTDGADIDLGGSGGDLALNAAALNGYDAGLVIGGIIEGELGDDLAIQTIANTIV